MFLLPIDEINKFGTKVAEWFDPNSTQKKPSKEDIIDEMLDLYLLSYMSGVNQVREDVRDSASAPSDLDKATAPTLAEINDSIYKTVGGKDFVQRTTEYYDNGGTVYDIMRIVETDSHRVYNEAALGAAQKVGAKTKKWQTMMDDKVRDPHWELQSVRIPIEDKFYVDGDSAFAPGGFESPELNINCRCYLTYEM